MDEEPILKKRKTEEEIRAEVQKEFEKENEIKEQAKMELQKEEMKEIESKEKRRSVGRIISRIFFALLFLFVLFETVMGVLDMQRLNDDKEPIWYINSEKKEENGKKEITYNLGLYVIVKTQEGKETKTTLRPFFLK